MGEDQTTKEGIDWKDGDIPVSTRFDDPYYSLQGGLAEARHVFLGGNDLPARFQPGFHVAELGFGTGLNMLATWRAWLDAGMAGEVQFTSFEAFPLSPADIARAHRQFPGIADLSDAFLSRWSTNGGQMSLPGLRLNVIVGDARDTLPNWRGHANAWFLDGFAPARNPELWGDGLLAQIGAKTAQEGTAATYSAAGHVRRGLEAAGFTVERRPGYGRKRHMSVARRKDAE